MKKEAVNPPAVFRSLDHGFSQAVAASGGQTLYVSGQVAWDSQKRLVGGADLEEPENVPPESRPPVGEEGQLQASWRSECLTLPGAWTIRVVGRSAMEQPRSG